MRIYLRTPLVNKSKMVPHLAEHCTGHSVLNLEDYFDFSYGMDGVINTDYTYFEFDKWIKYNDAIKKLTKEITKESFLYEKKIIKQELEDISYDQRIFEYVVKKYLDSDFFMNKYQTASRKDVKDYHEKYYVPENMIAVDDEFNILKQGFKTKNWCKDYDKKIVKNKLNFESDKYLVYLGKKADGTGYWEMYFFFWMLCFFGAYSQRWQKGEYYYLEPYFYEYEDNCFVLIGDYDYSQFDEEFFEGGKKYVINMFESGYFKEKFFLNEYFYGIPKTRKEVIQMCKNFTREEFKEFLELK